LKKKNPWENEMNYFKLKNKEMTDKMHEMIKKMAYFEDTHV
jgi:hypothetical protein